LRKLREFLPKPRAEGPEQFSKASCATPMPMVKARLDMQSDLWSLAIEALGRVMRDRMNNECI